jgi:hypothetical protein
MIIDHRRIIDVEMTRRVISPTGIGVGRRRCNDVSTSTITASSM